MAKKLLIAIAAAVLVYVAVKAPWSEVEAPADVGDAAARSVAEPEIPSPSAPEEEADNEQRDLGADRSEEEIAASPPGSGSPTELVRVVGRVIDGQTGRGVKGAAVWLFLGRLAPGYSPQTQAQTGDDGRFELRTPYDHWRTVQVDSEHHALFTAEIDRPARETALRQGIDVGDLTLSNGTRISGRVVTAQDEPVADAVILLHERISFPTFFPGSAREVGRSLSDGSFVLDRMPASDYGDSRLFASSPRGSGCTEIIILSNGDPMEEVEIRLEEIASLTVEVLDELGNALPDARVTALPVRDPYVHGLA